MANDSKPEDIESTVRIDSRQLINQADDAEDLISPDTFEEISDLTFSDSDAIIIPSQESIHFDDLNDEIEAMGEPSPAKKAPSPKPQPKKSVTVNEDNDEVPHIDLTSEMLVSNDTTTASSSNNNNPKKTSSGIGFVWASIILLSLIIAAVGAWMAFTAQARVDELALQLEFMENTPSQSTNMPNNDEELMDMHEQLDTLEQQFTTLKVQLAHTPLENTEPSQTTTPKESPVETSPVVITPVTSASPKKQTVKAPATKHVSVPTQQPKVTKPAKVVSSAWQVVVSSHNSMKKATAEQNRPSIKAIQTNIQPVTVKGKQWYRVVAIGFTSKQQAIDFTKTLKKQGIPDAWVQHIKP